MKETLKSRRIKEDAKKQIILRLKYYGFSVQEAIQILESCAFDLKGIPLECNEL